MIRKENKKNKKISKVTDYAALRTRLLQFYASYVCLSGPVYTQGCYSNRNLLQYFEHILCICSVTIVFLVRPFLIKKNEAAHYK